MNRKENLMKYLQIYVASIFISISIVFMILHANVFSLGYSFLEYGYFIISKIEIHLMWVGLIILYRVFKKKGKIHEISKRRFAKFR